jgi:hypothetical protein
MSTQHVHRCCVCDPELTPDVALTDPNYHTADKCGDTHIAPLLDGVAQPLALEVYIGDEGWILRVARDENGALHICPNEHLAGREGSVCSEVVFGHIELRS